MKFIRLAAGLAGAALALTACAPGASSANSGAPLPDEIKTGVPTGDVQLSLVSTPESGAAMKPIIAAFEAKYPNVKVKYSETNFDDYNKSLNLTLASDQSPDIALLNFIGTTVKDQLVIGLDGYAKAYGWDKTYPASQLAQWRVQPNGVTMGGGDLYAAPSGFSFVGVYYNKAKTAKLGINVPISSIADFDAALAKAKAAGELPLQLGNQQGHASFPVQLVGQATDGAANYGKWQFGQSGFNFDTPGNRKGLSELLDWTKKGYLPTDANGVDLQGAVDRFVKGQGVFFVDGTWDSAKIDKGLGVNAGFFPFTETKATAIGSSISYGISAKSKNKQAAAAFLDFLRDPAAVKESFAIGQLPSDVSSVTPAAGTVNEDIVKAWAQVGKDDGLDGYNNNVTATMNDTLVSQTQQLIGGKTTPDAVLKAVQDDWTKTYG
jgi:raffinose/stachyose/melibiose transport system substrate-binding protein